MNDPVDFAIAAALVALVAIAWPYLERAAEAWSRKTNHPAISARDRIIVKTTQTETNVD